MNFLADENIDRQIVAHLRQNGHLIWYVAEMNPGISDEGTMNYQFNLDSLAVNSGLSKKILEKLANDVQKEFPDDPMMQELHLRRYIDYEKHLKPQVQKKRKSH